MKPGSGVKLPLALFTLIAATYVANEVKSAVLTFGVPDLYASIFGFAVVTPILVYSVSASGDLEVEAYRRDLSVRRAGMDVLVVALSAMVGGTVGTSVAAVLLLSNPWQQTVGIVFAVLLGREVFVRRNNEHVADDVGPGIGARLKEWLD